MLVDTVYLSSLQLTNLQVIFRTLFRTAANASARPAQGVRPSEARQDCKRAALPAMCFKKPLNNRLGHRCFFSFCLLTVAATLLEPSREFRNAYECQ